MQMFEPKKLWKRRLGNHIKETSRYLRFMFNDHLIFALLFLLVAFAYFYQHWLETLPKNFPADWVMAIVIGFFVARSPIRTLLKEPDAVFLLPTEYKMGSYFKRAFLYSFFMQLYLLAIVIGALSPLYFTVYQERPTEWFIYLCIIIVILKVWNLFSAWLQLKDRNSKNRMVDSFIRFLLSVCILYFFLDGNGFLYASILSVIFIGLLLFNYHHYHKKGLAWDLLIEKEDVMNQSFYRIANLFTDVPQLKKKAKKRYWIVEIFTSFIPFQQKQTFTYLYRITFVRSSDYFGLYIRLLIIAAFLILWVPNIWFKFVFGLLFIYLSGFQLITLWNHFRTIQWIDIYPVTDEVRKQSLLTFLLQLMLGKTIILAIVMIFAASWKEASLLFSVGVLFSFLFVYYYARKRIEKNKY
jgi:ABC-2 type transport system permease protein